MLDRYENVRFNPTGKRLVDHALVEFLRGAGKAIVSLEKIDGELLDKLPELRVISKFGVGLDSIDQQALAARNVKLGWKGGVNKRAVAELVISMAINLLRSISQSDRQIRQGGWQQVCGRELSQVTFGILGCGHIGKEVARLLSAFGTQVLAHDLLDFPDFYQQYRVKPVSLDTLLNTADVVSVHLPLDESTHHILNADRLRKIRRGAYLINTSRGGVLDEKALAAALTDGRVAGAAIDVFEKEPPTGSSLIGLSNVLCTAHIGGSSKSAVLSMGEAAIEGLSG